MPTFFSNNFELYDINKEILGDLETKILFFHFWNQNKNFYF